MDTITLAKGGKAERTVKLNQVQIPDLWQIAHLPELKGYSLGGKPAKDLIIETWHLAHDLLRELRERGTQQ
jgi:hypothetical protein